jgi:hypothetical protein
VFSLVSCSVEVIELRLVPLSGWIDNLRGAPQSSGCSDPCLCCCFSRFFTSALDSSLGGCIYAPPVPASPDNMQGTHLRSQRQTRLPRRGDRVAPSARGAWNLHFYHHHVTCWNSAPRILKSLEVQHRREEGRETRLEGHRHRCISGCGVSGEYTLPGTGHWGAGRRAEVGMEEGMARRGESRGMENSGYSTGGTKPCSRFPRAGRNTPWLAHRDFVAAQCVSQYWQRHHLGLPPSTCSPRALTSRATTTQLRCCSRPTRPTGGVHAQDWMPAPLETGDRPVSASSSGLWARSGVRTHHHGLRTPVLRSLLSQHWT